MADSSNTGKTIGVVAIVIGAVIFLGIALVGVLASLAIYGFRSYLVKAKAAEGQMEVRRLAESMRSCAASQAGGLPETARPVPATLASVAGKKYMSTASDWSDPAYKCAGFMMSSPQYFQYQWEIVSPSSGRAVAQADFDGDGAPEVRFEMLVTCAGDQCSTGPLITK